MSREDPMNPFARVVRTTAMFASCALLVAACAAPSQPAPSTQAPSSASKPAAAATSAPAAANGQPIRIGMSMPLTGPTAYLGESAQKAVQMGMDDWNAKGGINGRKFELVTGDNAGQPQQG